MQRFDQQKPVLFRGPGFGTALEPAWPGGSPPELALDWKAGAWARWCARSFDVWWETALVATLLGLLLCRHSSAFLQWLETPFGWKLFGLACIPAGLLLDALLHTVAGNTPGKALLGLRLERADGCHPGLSELAQRNARLWCSGLGLGLPLLSLFTMARQALRLRKDLPATYDGALYLVRARPVGRLRKAVFGAAFCSLFLLIVALDAADRQDAREIAELKAAPPYGWTNPLTGNRVLVAPQWLAEDAGPEDEGEEGGGHGGAAPGRARYRFTLHGGHAVVLFSVQAQDGRSLREHVRARARQDHGEALADEAAPAGGRYGMFHGHPSWTGMAEGRYSALRVQTRIVEADGRFWRVELLQSPPVAYTDDLVQALGQALWDSVLGTPDAAAGK